MFTGLFFGSFNPIHNGHIAIARAVIDAGYCGSIWFVVSPQNPFKESAGLLDGSLRLAMVEKALADEPGMEACGIELSLPVPSYTADTLNVLGSKYPERRFALVMGGDNIASFQSWREWEKIAAEYPIFVYPRHGSDMPAFMPPGAVVMNVPVLDISATGIREIVASGASPEGFVPEAILDDVRKFYL